MGEQYDKHGSIVSLELAFRIDFKLVPHDRGYKLATVVDWLRSQLKIPVLTNLPFGHVATKVLLPVGAQAQLLVDGRDAMLYWG